MNPTKRSLAIHWLALAAVLGWSLLAPLSTAHAAAVLTIQPITWNVIGLDHNNVTAGPDIFSIGARVCNVGDTAATNVKVTYVPGPPINPFISLQGSDLETLASLPSGTTSLPPGNTGPITPNCADFYFNVLIARNSAAYDTTQLYHIEATADGLGTVSTPANRELYVEHLVSQERNSVTSFSGPTMVYVGQTYQYNVVAKTATNGYEQLVTSVDFPGLVFQILSVQVTYTAPSGATNNATYADACGWNPNIGTGTYRSCIGPQNYTDGKAGGTVTMQYTVKILSTGTATLTPIIYDFSGSSYHYNSDYGTHVLAVTAYPPTAVELGSFTATPQAWTGIIRLDWETLTEVNNLGFNLYRAESLAGRQIKLNASLIPSQGPGSPIGYTYSFVDRRVRASQTYYYWLEAVDLNGSTQLFGPRSAAIGPQLSAPKLSTP